MDPSQVLLQVSETPFLALAWTDLLPNVPSKLHCYKYAWFQAETNDLDDDHENSPFLVSPASSTPPTYHRSPLPPVHLPHHARPSAPPALSSSSASDRSTASVHSTEV